MGAECPVVGILETFSERKVQSSNSPFMLSARAKCLGHRVYYYPSSISWAWTMVIGGAEAWCASIRAEYVWSNW